MRDAPGTHQPSGRARWRYLLLGGAAIVVAWRSVNLLRGLTSRGRWTIIPPIVASPQARDKEKPHTAFEPSDWNIGPVALIYAGILVLLVVTCFVVIAGYPTALPDVGRTLRISPPGPQLQTDPERDLQQLRAKEEKKLNTYYWIDKQKGLVHVPIDETLKKLATTGIRGFPKGQQ